MRWVNTSSLAETPKMNSDSHSMTARKALDAFKSFSAMPSTNRSSLCSIPSSENPESMNVHHTKVVPPPNKRMTLNFSLIPSLTLFSKVFFWNPKDLYYPNPDLSDSHNRILSLKHQLLRNVDVVPFSPQSLLSFKSFFDLEAAMRTKLTETAISKIEGLMALYMALADVKSASGFAAVLILYAKTINQTALSSQLKNITTKLFDSYKPQSSSSSRPQWLDQMVSGLTNWKLLVNSPSFTQISRVISLLITLGVVESCSVNLGNFEIFAVQAQAKHCNAIDLVDALVETVTYFAEGAYQCFEQGSMKPLLFSSPKILILEEKCIQKQTEFEFVKNGNLQKFCDKSEACFDKELTELVDDLHEFYKIMPHGAEKKIIQCKWEQLSKMNAEFIALRVAGGLRKSPFCVKIFGNSGVGKSTFADLVMATVLKSAGVPSTSDYIVTLNEKEKYMSTYKSFVTGIKIDDYGNTKADFWECAPSDWIIKLCNNIREAAVMADIGSKGKISIEPSCLTITTNVESMHAGVTSYNPMSILRRAHVHVELNVRPEFKTDNMLDSKKVIQKFGNLDNIHDIWLVTVKKPIGDGEGKQNFSSWETLKSDMSIQDFLNYIITSSTSHYEEQTKIVESFKEPSNLVVICPNCRKLQSTCSCDLTPHYGERLASMITKKAKEVDLNFQKIRCNTETKVEDIAVDSLLLGFKWFEESPYARWTSWIPESFMDNEYVRSAILCSGRDIIGQSVKQYALNFFAIATSCVGIANRFHSTLTVPTAIACSLYGVVCFAGVVEAKKNAYLDELVANRAILNKTFISARDKHVHYACGAFAGLALLYSAAKLVQALRASMSMQGSLNPSSIAEIQERDLEVSPWKSEPFSPTKVFKHFGTMSEAETTLSKSMCQIQIKNSFSGAFILKTNLIAIPHHFLPKEVSEAKLLYGKRHIRFILNPALTQRVGNMDMVIVYVPNTGPLRDNTKRFMSEYVSQPMVATMYGIHADGSRFDSRIMWQFAGAIDNGYCYSNGSTYTMTGMNTFEGQCMSPILHEGDRKCIIGFHIGGKAGTPRGCGLAVLAPEIEIAISKLFLLSKSFIEGPQSCDIEDVIAGKNIFVSKEIHRKCPSRFIDKDGAVEIYGSVTGRATHTSDVIATPISDIVTEVTGVPNVWGPPKFKQPIILANGATDPQLWKPWEASLSVCSKPSIGFDPQKVDDATEDYLSSLKINFDKQSVLWKKDIRPLTQVEVVSGTDGKRFLDAMKTSTSMGFPMHGPKINHLIELPPTAEHACPRTFTPEIWKLVEELKEKADKGTFLNQIFGANLKDEATLLTKDKVRVFQAAPIALQILIREYFLPIARFLSLNPLVSECAVGINSQGPEWHELAQFMAKFGDDRIIAGDYSKYDLRMPAQLTLAAFGVMIEIARWSGNYTEIDLARMKVIAHDVCCPLVAYNGTLMRFMGTNPSGQNLTVYINSIVNSLLHRLAFHDVYDLEACKKIGKDLRLGRPARFRDLVSLSTYGDDAKGSVRDGYDEFNHVSMANYLAKNDMKFTMPDKTSAPVPFMSRFKADFLKRQDLYSEDLGHYVGALDENSIFKSLHSIIKSKVVTPTEVSAMNIGGAMREWFFHGREIFDKRLVQMKLVAEKANLPIPELEVTYDQRVEAWREKYLPPEPEVPPDS